MKLWIIYKNGIGFSKIIAEMLQDHLEEYIDVSVGNAKKIDPVYLIEEGIDYLIIGDIINKEIPSLELQNWLLKYGEISKVNNLILKALSGYYIALAEIKIEPFWIESLQDYINTEIIYPPILRLNLDKAEYALENRTLELIKGYSNTFIEFIIKNNQKK